MTSNGNPNAPDKLDILIDQVGHFTEGLTELRILVQAQAETAQKQLEAIDKQSAAIDKQSAAIEKQGNRFNQIDERLDRMAQTVEHQSHNIERIVSAMEASNRSQSEATNRLAAIVDCLLPPQP
ncbi:hypothetical protein H6F76_04990 [Leptolyngbya sp. FACHB-321]|uniref:hypothetical protein n=1 Tax=Leptolyngbya sp. FACHB-321 TaxID=2692807 RepID=UPI0016844D33|nr:hypothetical protein [Leptolyngbya sp. FACHB-321]MBD2034389.1 hypothetical protein [Leptolyngbya sp. FACHB-321]